MTDRVIAYPGDRPPMVCSPPCDYGGCRWTYRPATAEEARQALASHRRNWSDWQPDPELVALAEG